MFLRKSTVQQMIRDAIRTHEARAALRDARSEEGLHEHKREAHIRNLARDEIRKALGQHVRISRPEPIYGSLFPYLDISRLESDIEFLLQQADAAVAEEEEEEEDA